MQGYSIPCVSQKKNARANDRVPFRHEFILVPIGRDPSGLRQGSRPLAAPNFLACAEYSLFVFFFQSDVIFCQNTNFPLFLSALIIFSVSFSIK